MARIDVTCFARHNAGHITDRNQHEWTSIHIKKIVKGEKLAGKFAFPINGLMTNVNAQNVLSFKAELARLFARRMLADHGNGLIIVPVPNGDGAVGSPTVFPTLEQTNAIAANSAFLTSRGLLRWKEPMGKSHLKQRRRDVWQHKNDLAAPPRGTGRVVLYDDVVTTGSQLEACRQTLTEAGYSVVGAYATIEVIDKDARGDAFGWRTVSRDPQDMAQLFESFDNIPDFGAVQDMTKH